MNTDTPAGARRRNLVVLRAGDKSLHREWIAAPGRSFDLFISYYGSEPDRHRADADHYEMRKGPKWPCIGELLAARPDLVEHYEAFWFPDDDLSADTETIDRMFALFRGFGLALAQPALTPQSFHAHPMVLQRAGHVLRYAGFVEVMAPLFDRPALRACLDTFTQSPSGWGLDWVWPLLATGGRDHAIAILDATPVWHTRPLGGELYRNNPELSPNKDIFALIERHRLTPAQVSTQYGWTEGLRLVRAPWWERLVQGLKRLNRARRMRRRMRRLGIEAGRR